MERMRTIHHRGRLIHTLDYQGLKPDAMIDLQRQVFDHVKSISEEVYLMTTLEGTVMTVPFLKEATEFIEVVKSRVTIALLGVSGPKVYILKGFIALNPDFRVRSFSSEAEALAYLTRDIPEVIV